MSNEIKFYVEVFIYIKLHKMPDIPPYRLNILRQKCFPSPWISDHKSNPHHFYCWYRHFTDVCSSCKRTVGLTLWSLSLSLSSFSITGTSIIISWLQPLEPWESELSPYFKTLMKPGNWIRGIDSASEPVVPAHQAWNRFLGTLKVYIFTGLDFPQQIHGMYNTLYTEYWLYTTLLKKLLIFSPYI